ncbi:MAG: TlpA family protein disulfide reductase [Pseudomonadota bacterium]|jgi:peroxiredoxin|nr:TlpA family protein disulfide reductase [Pseudomonadota bacterium]MDO7667513.1 TlpA family protein disulfide reductase [Pseudomonadota bacterium]MDO7711819.1 TlpA family protein disulfide reductase [Pseudomonadota bacterium]
MKTQHRNILLALVLIVALFAINWLNTSSSMRPELSFTDIDGQQHSLSQYTGKPILLTFWATDCPGCIQEMPDLIALHNQYTEQGLVMIDVAMAHDSLHHIKAMRDERKLPFIITWDHNAEMALAFDNVRVTPTHFLIAPEGEIIMRKIGNINIDYMHEKLQKMGFVKS